MRARRFGLPSYTFGLLASVSLLPLTCVSPLTSVSPLTPSSAALVILAECLEPRVVRSGFLDPVNTQLENQKSGS